MKSGMIIQLTGVVVAFAALFVSCHSNYLATSNQSKLERLECFDKVERMNKDLVPSYRKALTSATRIHNYFPGKTDVTQAHTEFQASMINTLQSANDISRVVKRYEFKCEGEVGRIFGEIAKMGEMVKGTDTYDQFGGFNSKLQNQHHDNIAWLFEKDVADACCSKR